MQVLEPIALAYQPVALALVTRHTGYFKVAFNCLAAATARDDMLDAKAGEARMNKSNPAMRLLKSVAG
jgi:hypothetical protein